MKDYCEVFALSYSDEEGTWQRVPFKYCEKGLEDGVDENGEPITELTSHTTIYLEEGKKIAAGVAILNPDKEIIYRVFQNGETTDYLISTYFPETEWAKGL